MKLGKLSWYIYLFFIHCTSFFSLRTQLPCSIEDRLLKAQSIDSVDFYNGHELHHVASGNNAMCCSFILPFHIGCGGAHYIKEIGS